MNILAIESSCDDTAAAVVKDGREVLSSVIASQVPEHILYGGVVPEIASRRHCESISGVVKQALSQAGMTLSDVDAVACTYAPGLIGALLVGVNFAKGLSYAADLPLIPVHHLRSHIASNYISHTDLKPPFLHAYRVYETDEKTIEAFYEIENDLSFEPVAFPYEKIPEALKFIYENGGKNFLYTHRDRVAVEYLEKYGLSQYFEGFVTRENGFPLKPAGVKI